MDINKQLLSDDSVKEMFPDIDNQRAAEFAQIVNGFISANRVSTREGVEDMLHKLYSGQPPINQPDENSKKPFAYPDDTEENCDFKNYLMKSGVAGSRKDANEMGGMHSMNPYYHQYHFDLMKKDEDYCESTDSEIWQIYCENKTSDPSEAVVLMQAIQMSDETLLRDKSLATELLSIFNFIFEQGIGVDELISGSFVSLADFVQCVKTLCETTGEDPSKKFSRFLEKVASTTDGWEVKSVIEAVECFAGVADISIHGEMSERLAALSRKEESGE